MFCEAHRSSASEVLPTESIEHMKSLMIADEKKDGNDTDGKFCLRLGSLTIHSLGDIEQMNLLALPLRFRLLRRSVSL